jgi:PAS domain-containing protein
VALGARELSSALATSELRYQSLFQHNPDAVYSLDLAGQFVSINPATALLTGFQAHELLHTSFLNLTVPEHMAAVRLLGAQVVLVGISPAMAQTLVHLGVDLGSLTTAANLASGLEYALH